MEFWSEEFALALHMAIQHYTTRDPQDKQENLYILSDCKTAIDLVINRQQVDHHIHVLARVRNHLHTLCDMNVHGCYNCMDPWTLLNVFYNDLADVSANNSIKDTYDIPTTSELTTVLIHVKD